MGNYMRKKVEKLKFVKSNESYLRQVVECGMEDDTNDWLYNKGFIGKQTYQAIKCGNITTYQQVLQSIALLLEQI